jgi:radical SAM protein with 4Fe4S-binding SPASM domain
LRELGGMIISFTGGEPLLRDDIFLLATYARKKGLLPYLFSNGTLIDEHTAIRIKDAGFTNVYISLLGLKKNHDVFRRSEGSFNRAWRAIQSLIKNGLKVGIIYPLTKFNLRDISPLIDLAVAEGVTKFIIHHPIKIEPKESDSILTPSQRKELIDLLIAKVTKYTKEIDILTANNPQDGVYLYKFLKETEFQIAHLLLQQLEYWGRCSAGVRCINITNNGDVLPCRFWKNFVLGNIKERNFKRLWQDRTNEYLNMLRNKNNYLHNGCSECKHSAICGGCRARALLNSGDCWAKDPWCYINELKQW